MWLTRRSWPALCFLFLGMLLCNILACAVPLATRASITRSLQHALNRPYQNTIVVVASSLPNQDISSLDHQLDAEVSRLLASAVTPQAQLALRSQDLSLNARTSMHLKSLPDSYLVQNFRLMAGRFPDPTSWANEVVITQQTALALHIELGTKLTGRLVHAEHHSVSLTLVPLIVVGIVEPGQTDLRDPFNAEPIEPVVYGNQSIITALTIAPIFSRVVTALQRSFPSAEESVGAMWVYRVQDQAVNAMDFERIQAGVQALYRQVVLVLAPYTGTASVYGEALPALEAYDSRIATTQLPLTAMAIQLGILLFWFIIAMVDLLLDRSEESIALLRSRGAYPWQLLPGMLIPVLLVAFVGSLVGPWLAEMTITYLPSLLDHASSNSIALPEQSPWQQLMDLKWYTLATAAATVTVCIFVAYRELNTDIVQLRRHISRGHHGAAWRRYRLDVIAALAFLSLYVSYSIFISPVIGLAAYARVAPLAIYVPIFALVTAGIVLLRVFPYIFNWCINLSKRWRGVVPVLTSVNLAQSETRTRQASIFLALAIALLCFESSYQATRTQHDRDYAAFQVGADFGFALPIDTSDPLTAQQQEDRFLRISGVQAASAGALIDIFPQLGSSARDRIMAVDAQTYAAVAAWQDASSRQSMTMLSRQLARLRGPAESSRVVPAIVDDAMSQRYQLTSDSEFTLDLSGTGALPIRFQVLGQVSHLPMIPDVPGDASLGFLGGMMVDFQTLAQIIPQVNAEEKAPAGYMWLRTAHDPASVARIRLALAGPPYYIATFQDRFQLLDDMAYDPLSVALQDVIVIGAGIVVMLAVIVSSQMFFSALERRVLSFSTLYAVGASRLQIMAASAAEHIVQLFLASLSGLLLGVLLVQTTVPLITFAQSSDTLQPAVTLLIPPPTVSIPWRQLLMGTGLSLILFSCLVMLAARQHVKRQNAKTLRLSED